MQVQPPPGRTVGAGWLLYIVEPFDGSIGVIASRSRHRLITRRGQVKNGKPPVSEAHEQIRVKPSVGRGMIGAGDTARGAVVCASHLGRRARSPANPVPAVGTVCRGQDRVAEGSRWGFGSGGQTDLVAEYSLHHRS